MAEKLEEKVIWVDENNNVLGSIGRKEMREKCLWHRATTIFIVNS
jgi:isopentenyldiphosphate isomerase